MSTKTKKKNSVGKKVRRKSLLSEVRKGKTAALKSNIRLGIIVGRRGDTSTNHALKEIPIALLNENDNPPADVAVAWYIKKKYPAVTVDVITPDEISLSRLNKNDFIYVMYDLIDAYNEGGIDLFQERTKMYSKTTAIMYPTVSLQKLIISKSRYYNLLEKHSIPIAPFISITKADYVSNTISARKRIVRDLLESFASNEWPGIIAKPELGSYGTGIKIFHDLKKITEKTLLSYLQKSFVKDNFEGVVFQRYMEDFPHYFEIRTYWINGEYVRSVGTIIDYATLGTGEEELYIDTPKNEGGDIPSFIIDPLKEIGKRVIKILPRAYPSSPNLLVRLDFGCCQVLDDTVKGVQPDMCKKYFLNEIELTPNLFPDYGSSDIIKLLGDALVEKARSMIDS